MVNPPLDSKKRYCPAQYGDDRPQPHQCSRIHFFYEKNQWVHGKFSFQGLNKINKLFQYNY